MTGRAKIAAGVAGLAAAGALSIPLGLSQGGGTVDIFVGATPTPVATVATGAANLWIDSDGGTCTRQGTAGAYSNAGACSSAQTAYAAASCGDRVRYADGTYSADQTISSATTGLNCASNAYVIFSPDNDTVNAYGRQADTILSGGLTLNPINCTCEFRDFDTYSDTGVAGAATGTEGMVGSDRDSAGTTGSVKAILRRIDAHLGYFGSVSDVSMIGGSIGDWNSCGGVTVDGVQDLDGIKIWASSAAKISNRVTIDGVIFHNIRRNGACAFHTDGIQIGGGDGHVIKNIRTYDMPTSNILVRSAITTVSNLTLQNNMFGSLSDGSSSIFLCDTADDCTGSQVLYNTNSGGSFSVGDTTATVVGNYSGGNWDNSGSTTSNNAYGGGATISPGGSPVYNCTPSWKAGDDTTLGFFHIATSDTCLRGRGNAVTFPATDWDGDSRPLGTMDIGADEVI